MKCENQIDADDRRFESFTYLILKTSEWRIIVLKMFLFLLWFIIFTCLDIVDISIDV